MAQPFAAVLTSLVNAGVDFVVVGGVAVNAHGFGRNTLDLDLIVRFDRENVEKLSRALSEQGYSPRLPINPADLANQTIRAEWKQRNMVALSFLLNVKPFTVIDIFIDHPIQYDELVKQAVRFVYGDVSIRICGIRHLIELKERAGRGKDLEDLKFLYEILDQQQEGLR